MDRTPISIPCPLVLDLSHSPRDVRNHEVHDCMYRNHEVNPHCGSDRPGVKEVDIYVYY